MNKTQTMAEEKSSPVGESKSSSDKSTSSEVFAELQCPPHTTERKLMARVDMRLIPVLFFVYLLAFLDRVNISSALTLGLPQELKLNDKTSQESNIALAVFFVPYILLDIPANYFMRYFKPHVWLSGCLFTFGVLILAQGFVKSFGGLVATRLLLGVAETGILPGCFYLISFYYKRDEAQKRFTWFFSSANTGGAFGSLIASGIADMGTRRGLTSWRWLFIIEGAITIAYGIAAYFLIIDFPATAAWLREDERDFILGRVALDRKVDNEPITTKGVLKFFTHGKKVIGGIMYFANLIPLYTFALFAPTIIKQNFNVTVVQTQLLTAPPFMAGVVWALMISYISDKVKLRFPFLLFSGLLGIAAIAILQSVHSGFGTRYAALMLYQMAFNTACPILICWCTMNLTGHLDRAVGTAWIIGFGNAGGLIATFTMPAKDAPTYHNGFAINQAAACLAVGAYVVYFLLCMNTNRKLKQQNRTDLYML